VCAVCVQCMCACVGACSMYVCTVYGCVCTVFLVCVGACVAMCAYMCKCLCVTTSGDGQWNFLQLNSKVIASTDQTPLKANLGLGHLLFLPHPP